MFCQDVGYASAALSRWPESMSPSAPDEASKRRGLARYVRRIVAGAQTFISAGERAVADFDGDLCYFDSERLAAFVDVIEDLTAPIARYLRNETEEGRADLCAGMVALIEAGQAFLSATPATTGRVVFVPLTVEDDSDGSGNPTTRPEPSSSP